MQRSLIYCNKTQRWLLSRNADYWDLPEQGSGKYIGVIRPDNIIMAWQAVPNEHLALAGEWAWHNYSNIVNIPQGKYLEVIAPQLKIIAERRELVEIGKVTVPANTVSLFFSEQHKYSSAFRATDIWHKGMHVGGALVRVDSGMLYNVNVNEAWRGRGIASMLMRHLISSKYPPKQLIARPTMKNPGLVKADLIKFYQRFGFEVIDYETSFMVRPIELAIAAVKPSEHWRKFNTELQGVKGGHAPYLVRRINSPEGTFFNVYQQGHKVASVKLSPTGKYVTDLSVAPEHQHRGIATALYKYIEDQLGYPLEPRPTYQIANIPSLGYM